MGKAKKGKKLDHEEDNGDGDVEVVDDATKNKEKKGKTKSKTEDVEISLIENEDDSQSKKKKGKKDKKKKGDNENDDEVNEVTKELQELSTKGKRDKLKKKVSVDSDEEDSVKVEKPLKKDIDLKKGRKTKNDSDSDSELVSEVRTKKSSQKPGFALLAVSDEDEEAQVTETKEESDNDVMVEVAKTSKKEKGGKKGKKKKKDEDEEDIEQMLAELEIEYSGGTVVKEETVIKEQNVENQAIVEEESEDKKKKKKKKKVDKDVEDINTEEVKENIGDGEEIGTIKSAAQKKKEKKEREKQKKLEAKKTEATDKKTPSEIPDLEEKPSPADLNEDKPKEHDEDDEADEDKKKKKKKKKGEKEEKDLKDKKGPGKKTLAAMKEALQKLKEDEERHKKEEEERIKKLEEAEKQREEQLKLEQEKKEKKKQKEKERKERLKAEGKLLTAKQKADRARAQATLEALKAQGLDVPDATVERKPRPGTRIRPKKAKPELSASDLLTPETPVEETIQKTVQVEIIDPVKEETVKEEEEAVKDSWDLESSEDEEEDKSEETAKPQPAPTARATSQSVDDEDDDDEEEEDSSSDEESSSEEESDDSSEEEDEEEKKSDAQKKREKAIARMQKRKEDAELKKTLDELRAAVVCVLGHVDTGKTKILDKLRRTNVQDGEAGGITQQIGATNVPMDAIKENTKYVKAFAEFELKVPGLLIIDTPGHESFSNLRNRGSSLCDIAILVVDIMHGLEPQTIESINLLKSKKTPFIVALNKIDRLYDWNTMARRDVRDIIKAQAANTQLEFEQRTKEVVLQFAQQGLNAALFYDNPDPRSYVSLVPTSAITGEGMGNLLALIVQSCQSMLAKRLMFSEELQATVLEVKAIPGLGTTIDVILVNGYLREGDTAVLAGTDGPIVTQIRSLLMPQPMKELRVKNAYVEYKEIKAAQGVKIAAKDLEKAIAGLNLQVAQKPDEVEILREEVAKELKKALSGIRLSERGVYVQASTLGSLEALLEFLRTSKIPYSNIRIGPVVKKDVMKASIMLEHESQYATILAFDVKVERDAQELADTLGVKIFQADIIYHLFDKFMAYREELRQKKRDEFKHIAVFPCKLKILPQFIFNSRDPIVMGVMVEAGIIREGTPICVPSKEFVDLGIVTSIENNHKNVESARKGQEVCIKIEPIPGEAPKMFGRHFDEKDFLISKISRQSIDACKDYFRDDLLKTDWQLMVELKKLFQIL